MSPFKEYQRCQATQIYWIDGMQASLLKFGDTDPNALKITGTIMAWTSNMDVFLSILSEFSNVIVWISFFGITILAYFLYSSLEQFQAFWEWWVRLYASICPVLSQGLDIFQVFHISFQVSSVAQWNMVIWYCNSFVLMSCFFLSFLMHLIQCWL